MSNMFLLLGVCFLTIGLLPLLRWLKCKVSKHHWRACYIDNITSAIDKRVTTLEFVQNKTMLVSFKFDNTAHSVLIDYDESLVKRFARGKKCTLLVDNTNPEIVYRNSQLWNQFSGIWLLAGSSFFLASVLL